MAKTLRGKVISTSMQNTAVVEVTRRTPHPVYKKLLTKSKKYKVDTRNVNVNVGDEVVIVETRPISKEKHFAVAQVIKKQGKEK
ncbi:MAG: 30S ribosomal protein S17 [Patescibacteria group bacterium]|nr:MAG: 30S ribosomal protein S17 [Patescibacteria group bacterium]